MILHELCGRTEQHPVYSQIEVENGNRQYDFLKSIVGASIQMQRPFLSSQLVKALNFHAIVCLHTNAGEYRPCDVMIDRGPSVDPSVPPEKPTMMPEPYRVQGLMDEMINRVNSAWSQADPFNLAAFVLWQLNFIHPFINGNGRTARAACYFVICLKLGGWPPGQPILPELLGKRNRDEYVTALRVADARGDLSQLTELLIRLFGEQVNTPAQPTPP